MRLRCRLPATQALPQLEQLTLHFALRHVECIWPDALGSCGRLRRLRLAGAYANTLVWPLPQSASNLTALESLDIPASAQCCRMQAWTS